MADDFQLIPPTHIGELVDGRPAAIGIAVLSVELRDKILADAPGARDDLFGQVRAALIASVGGNGNGHLRGGQ